MKLIKNKKIIAITAVWILSAAILVNQIPAQAIDNTPSPSPAAKNATIDVIKDLRSKTNNSSSKMLSLATRFDVFPESATIDLTLRDVEIASILRIIAKEGGKNIVIDESVQGTISAELKKISLNEAMQSILTSEELEARVEGNTIFVASRPTMAKKGLNRKFIKAFRLNNSNAVEIAKILEASIFNKGYKVNDTSASAAGGSAMQAVTTQQQPTGIQPAVNNQQNGSTSTGQSSIVQTKTIKGKVETLEAGSGSNDSAAPASEIKLQAVKASTQDITIDNNDGGAIVIPDTRTNSILVSGLKEDIALAEETIKYLDKPLKQVSIEVSLVELSKNKAKDLGLSGGMGSNHVYGNFNHQNAYNLTEFANSSQLVLDSVRNIDDVVGNGFNLRLKALLQTEDARVLTNPNILALDGSESMIKITDRIVSSMEVTVDDGTITYKPILEDIGIVLNILPKISDDGNVTMRVRPSVTSPVGAPVRFGDDGAFVTLVSTREILLQDVRVKSGDTLAIGGIIKEKEIDSIGKIPVAGDLPLFGSLFKNKTHKHDKTELVILITPKIVDDISYN